VLGENDWRKSIKAQGVMEAVWLAASTFVHGDGSASATVPISVEGSSRTTDIHDILGFRSSSVPYEDLDRECPAHYKRVNDVFERRTTDRSDDPPLASAVRETTRLNLDRHHRPRASNHHRAPRTYAWYRENIQKFFDGIPHELVVAGERRVTLGAHLDLLAADLEEPGLAGGAVERLREVARHRRNPPL
jgi:hypothetical protein